MDSTNRLPDRRFACVANCEMDVLSVHEADTLTNLAPAADPDALEFGTARYCYDAQAGKLYLSTSDFQPASRRRYTIGVRKALMRTHPRWAAPLCRVRMS